jgi:hypothetical protein
MRISIDPMTTLQPLRNISHEVGLIIDARAKIFQRVTSRRRSIGESAPIENARSSIPSPQSQARCHNPEFAPASRRPDQRVAAGFCLPRKH